MSQLHIRAEQSDVAPLVLLPGDPDRATFIAENFFENPVCYNSYRQLLGYTGTYKGKRVSVQTTGMGCPSAAIVIEELIRLGAKQLIRVGTSGIINKNIKPTELIVATSSVPKDGTTKQYLKGASYAPTASFEITKALAEAAEKYSEQQNTGQQQKSRHHVGLIQTEDAFYATSPDDVEPMAKQGVLAVEMEAAILFLLGKLRNVDTGCMLVASNYIGDAQFVDPEDLQKAVSNMIEITLEASLNL